MNGLCSLLKPDNVLLGISPSSKKRIFEQASQTLSLLYGLDKKEIFDGLFARERLGSTYLDHGIALPHCRLPNIKEPCCLFVKLHGELRATVRANRRSARSSSSLPRKMLPANI